MSKQEQEKDMSQDISEVEEAKVTTLSDEELDTVAGGTLINRTSIDIKDYGDIFVSRRTTLKVTNDREK